MNVEPMWIAVGAVAAVLVARRLLGGVPAPSEVVTREVRGGAVVVDVRTPEEFARGAYPGAINVPLAGIRSRLGEIPKDRAVVLYCASGIRSAAAARILRREGYPQVLNAGGVRRMPW